MVTVLLHDLHCSVQDSIDKQTSLDDAALIAMPNNIANLDMTADYHHHGRAPDSVADLDGASKQRVTETPWTVG